jgi:hypothetical protein
MIEYRIEDVFATSADQYWEMFFSDAYNTALWDHLDIDRVQLDFRVEGQGDDEVIHRVQRLTPRRELPKVMQKIIKGAIAYEERNVFRRRDSSMDVVTIPNFFADRFKATGTYRLESRGEGKVARIWDARCACKVPLVGSKVERHIVEEVKQSYAATTAFTQRWIAEQL